MPALYAHDRFGEKVSEKSDGELKNIIFKYYNQYEVGLQGPDILFFYRPYHGNDVAKYGSHLHAVSALPFFEHAAKVVNHYGRDSAQYKISRLGGDSLPARRRFTHPCTDGGGWGANGG